jgi:hypothetical protein
MKHFHQQLFPCLECINCSGNLLTEPLPTNILFSGSTIPIFRRYERHTATETLGDLTSLISLFKRTEEECKEMKEERKKGE